MAMTHEAGARPCVLERVSTMLAPHGLDMTAVGGGGGAALRPADFAAMMAGLRETFPPRTDDDRWLVSLAELAWQAKFQDDGRYRKEMVNNLHVSKSGKIVFSSPDLQVSGRQMERLCELVVSAYCDDQIVTRDDAKKALGIGAEKWAELRRHYGDLLRRIRQAEGMIVQHLRRQIRIPVEES